MSTTATQRLRDHGLRATQARIDLLTVLDQAKKPLRPQDIAAKLKADTATVYRSLGALVERGLVKRLDLDKQAKFYELERGDDHHHLVCTTCQKIEDVRICEDDTCRVDELAKRALSGSSFSNISHHRLEFFGLCNTCSK